MFNLQVQVQVQVESFQRKSHDESKLSDFADSSSSHDSRITALAIGRYCEDNSISWVETKVIIAIITLVETLKIDVSRVSTLGVAEGFGQKNI